MKEENTVSELVGFGYPFYIDYAQPIEKLILEGGYAKIDEIFSLELKKFTEKYDSDRDRKKINDAEGFLKHSGSCVFPDYEILLKELDENNLRPANLRELLCFGSSYRHIQRQFDVIALGSINKIGPFFQVPMLSTTIGLMERSLGVFRFKNEEYGVYFPESNLPLKGNNRLLVLSKG